MYGYLSEMNKNHIFPVKLFFLLSFFVVLFLASCGGGGGSGTSSSDKKKVKSPPFLGRKYIGSSRCAHCHDSKKSEWKKTKHSSAISVVSKDSEICVQCHTTGFNKKIKNGGYDENAQKGLENVGCESCHGEGARYSPHYSSRSSARKIQFKRTLLSLQSGNCGKCHTKTVSGSMSSGQYDQWVNSAHSDSLKTLKGHKEFESSCLECHSADSIYFNKSVSLRTVVNPVACVACHDVHSSENEFQLRLTDTAKLPGSSAEYTAGNAAICFSCHNDGIKDVDDAVSSGVIPRNNQAQLLVGTGGFEYGETIDNSYHTQFAEKCLTCHGFDTPSSGEAGNNTIGAHTFMVKDKDDNELLSACEQCHLLSTPFNRTARADYDGDGSKEGIQSEVNGLLVLLKSKILESGNVDEDTDSFGRAIFIFSSSATDEEKRAAFNWSFINNDGSGGVHNPGYAVKLLQLSYNKLTGSDVPGATLR